MARSSGRSYILEVRTVPKISRTSSIWIVIGTAGAAALSFLFQGILSVTLTDAEFGMLSSSMIIAVSLSVLMTMGAQDVTLHLVKDQELDPDLALSSYNRVWLYHCAPTLLIGISVFSLSGYATPSVLFIAVFSVLICAFVIQTAYRQSRDDFFGVGALLLGIEVCKMAATGLAVAAGFRQLDTLYLMFSGFFLLTILLWVARPSFRGRSPSNTVPYRELLSLGIPYAIAGFLFIAYYRITIVVLSSAGLHDEAGSLSVIYLFLGAILLLPTTYSQKFLQGRWHSLPAGYHKPFVTELRRQYALILIFAAPIFLIWFFLSEPILALLYPGRYQLAVEHGKWFAFVFVLRCICIPLQGASSVAGLRWGKLGVVLVAALATFIASLALTPIVGFMSGLAAALLAEVVFVSGLSILLWRRWAAI